MSLPIWNTPAKNLIEISTIDSRIKLDIRYATVHNFLGFAMYSKAVCYLHQIVAAALSRVQDEIEPLKIYLKVYDGYRPLPVQQFMWDIVQDERYVANPVKNKGSHTRGTAVDLTLVDGEGFELEMPTPFDEFSQRAHSDSFDISKQALLNRILLKAVMEKQGFSQSSFEWWHFDYQGWDNDNLYPPLSVTFEELEALNAKVSSNGYSETIF
jgi:D-alanyl-D-alanine dipeptidase